MSIAEVFRIPPTQALLALTSCLLLVSLQASHAASAHISVADVDSTLTDRSGPGRLPLSRDGAKRRLLQVGTDMVDKLSNKKWASMHASFAKEATTVDYIDVLFAGDSLTEGWKETFFGDSFSGYAGAKAEYDSLLNRMGGFVFAIAGDKVENLRWRLLNPDSPELPNSLSVGVLVLNIGTNNALGNNADSAQVTADKVLSLVNAIRASHPKTKIILVGLLPASYPSSKETVTVPQPAPGAVNALLLKGHNSSDPAVAYEDCSSYFLSEDGSKLNPLLYIQNPFPLLHLTAEGYKAWAQCLKGPITTALGMDMSPTPTPMPAPGITQAPLAPPPAPAPAPESTSTSQASLNTISFSQGFTTVLLSLLLGLSLQS